MKFAKEIEDAIKTFIIEQVPSHKNDIVTFTMNHFDISKPTAAKFLNQLISENIIEMKRKGRYPDYSLVTHENDWILENPDSVSGTAVSMLIAKNSHLNISDIFNEYADPDKQPGFYKTRIPVKLMEYEGELLLSRSQAKRLITRFDKFLEVVLDFQGVTEIGQAFADEVFRVFRNAHPNVHLEPINCSPTVQRMIAYISADYFQNIYNS